MTAQFPSTRTSRLNSRQISLVVAILLIAIGIWGGEKWAHSSAKSIADGEASQLARSNGSLFESELQKFRLLPTVLTEYPDVVSLLRQPEGNAGPLNRKLELLANRTGAAAIYVIQPDGLTFAASNYRQKTSFVGQNYGFRPYFTEAMARGSSELFALGTVSGRPGLFIASRVGSTGTPLGIIVVKIEFDRLQRSWAAQKGITFITDRHDVVIVSSRPDWQFRMLRPLRPAEVAEIQQARQFNNMLLRSLPVSFSGKAGTFAGKAYRREAINLSLRGSRLTALVPLDSALQGTRARVRLILLAITIGFAGIVIWFVRQSERLSLQRTAQLELETKVHERTADLREVNDLLVREGAKRQRSEERYRRSREELAQANRLATLGQVAAGVAHEINQPVAAIRTFSENAIAYIARRQADVAATNLGQIVGLTDRIAQITSELRSFSRRQTPNVAPIRLDDAFDAALMLVHHRITASGTEIVWCREAAARTVKADRIRLEQVFVNVVQNALDALTSCKNPKIEIRIAADVERVVIEFVDNGGGVPAAVRQKLFTPFATGRADGLGLGLAIARDILREFGGDLELASTGPRGSIFRAILVRA